MKNGCTEKELAAMILDYEEAREELERLRERILETVRQGKDTWAWDRLAQRLAFVLSEE